MVLISQAQADTFLEFSFQRPDKSPSPLLKLDGIAAGYGEEPIIEAVTLSINPGDRIGLLGPNGAGKSTFIKLLAGVIPSLSGERLPAQDLKIGYFAQHQLEQLEPEQTALWHLQQLDARASERDLRNYLGGFGFQGDRALEPIAPFSGGEKSRLVLAMLIYQKPNLLLLDEPTNHLDLQTRDALSLALQEYEGALVVVSHDRYLLRTVADDLYLIADGSVSLFDGDLEDYRRWLSQHRHLLQSSLRTKTTPTKSVPRQDDQERRKKVKSLTTRIEKAESMMNKALLERQSLEEQMAAPGLYESSDQNSLEGLLKRKRLLDEAIETHEADWLEALEHLESEQAEVVD